MSKKKFPRPLEQELDKIYKIFKPNYHTTSLIKQLITEYLYKTINSQHRDEIAGLIDYCSLLGNKLVINVNPSEIVSILSTRRAELLYEINSTLKLNIKAVNLKFSKQSERYEVGFDSKTEAQFTSNKEFVLKHLQSFSTESKDLDQSIKKLTNAITSPQANIRDSASKGDYFLKKSIELLNKELSESDSN